MSKMQSYSFWSKCILTEINCTCQDILFVDVSSAFNLIQHHILADKLIYDFNLVNQIVAWIVEFLSCRRQCVFVNGKCSDMRLLCLTPSRHHVH